MGVDYMSLVTFQVGEIFCGIDIRHVQEINRLFEITFVPKAPEYVRGVLNLRGQIVTIIDLAEKLGVDSFKESRTNRNIIVKSENEHIGLFVERVGDILQGKPDDMEPPPANAGNGLGRFFKGVLKRDDQLIGILNIEEVMK